MSNSSFLERNFADFTTAVNTLIHNTAIVEYGIINKVVDDTTVVVSILATRADTECKNVVCKVMDYSASSIQINVKLAVDDRVLVIYPRLFTEDMFDATEPIHNEFIYGYNRVVGGICIPLTTKKESDNHIDIEDGSVSIYLHKEKVKIKITDSNDIELETNGKYSIKNGATDLKTVFDHLIRDIKAIQTFGSPAQHSMLPTSQELFELDKTEIGNLLK